VRGARIDGKMSGGKRGWNRSFIWGICKKGRGGGGVRGVLLLYWRSGVDEKRRPMIDEIGKTATKKSRTKKRHYQEKKTVTKRPRPLYSQGG